jgi:hypothetical protein
MCSRRVALRLAGTAIVVAIASGLLACVGTGTEVPLLLPESGAGSPDGSVPDGCVSHSSKCNSCEAPDADPSNACSAFTGGCTAFDAARVPSHPTL